MDAYAGYFLESEKLNESSSGGAASAIAEGIVKEDGVVYGAVYSENFHFALFDSTEKEEELRKFKGSKYVYVNKILIREEEQISVYEDVVSQLIYGHKVLFIGLGCDIATLKSLTTKKNVGIDKLFTIELLCDGVTNEIVHEQYVSNIEKIYGSKVIAFNVRYKKEGWGQQYIYAKFENGKEHMEPFYNSEYWFAFQNYKRKSCYNCRFKNEKHMGDLIVGDFWGCKQGMREYNENGVSLLLVESGKGYKLLQYLDPEVFFLRKVDVQYALYNNPRYFNCHEKYSQWEKFDKIIKEKGLHESVKVCAGISMPKRFKNVKFDEFILWGTGNCFRKYGPLILERYFVSCVLDNNEKNWGKELGHGVVCMSPEVLKNKRNFFVLIMIEDTGAAFQVVNNLLDMEITKFDYVHNWLRYVEEEEKT